MVWNLYYLRLLNVTLSAIFKYSGNFRFDCRISRNFRYVKHSKPIGWTDYPSVARIQFSGAVEWEIKRSISRFFHCLSLPVCDGGRVPVVWFRNIRSRVSPSAVLLATINSACSRNFAENASRQPSRCGCEGVCFAIAAGGCGGGGDDDGDDVRANLWGGRFYIGKPKFTSKTFY